MEFLVWSGCQTPQKMEVPHATGPLACCYWPLWATMEAWFKRRRRVFSGKLGSFFSVDFCRAFQVHPSKKRRISAMDMFVSFCEVVFQNRKKGETFLLTVCDTFSTQWSYRVARSANSWNQSRLIGTWWNHFAIDATSTPSKWRCDTPYKVLRKSMGRKKRKTKSYLHLDQVCWVYPQKLRSILESWKWRGSQSNSC